MALTTSAVIAAAGVANSVYQGGRSRDAARRSEQAQLQAAQQAQQGTQAQFDQVRDDLSPYRQAGALGAPLLSEFSSSPQAQYDFLQSNPIFQASLNTRDRESAGLAARQGRIGTGDFSQQLQENYLASAMPLIQQRENQLLNLTQVGGNAAAQTGQFGANAQTAMNDYGIQGANARAAGIAARNQGSQQTANQVLNGLGTLAPIVGGIVNPPKPPIV